MAIKSPCYHREEPELNGAEWVQYFHSASNHYYPSFFHSLYHRLKPNMAPPKATDFDHRSQLSGHLRSRSPRREKRAINAKGDECNSPAAISGDVVLQSFSVPTGTDTLAEPIWGGNLIPVPTTSKAFESFFDAADEECLYRDIDDVSVAMRTILQHFPASSARRSNETMDSAAAAAFPPFNLDSQPTPAAIPASSAVRSAIQPPSFGNPDSSTPTVVFGYFWSIGSRYFRGNIPSPHPVMSSIQPFIYQ